MAQNGIPEYTVAEAILNSELGIPLRGSAIGNGWIDARRQYPAYLDYAVKHGLVELGSAVSSQTQENGSSLLTSRPAI